MADACDITHKPPEVEDNPPDETIKKILSQAKTIAVVGLSNKPNRESYSVGRYLMDHGFQVIPVHPNISAWEGLKVYKSLADVTEVVDVVDIFRRADAIGEMADGIIAIKPKAAWFQLGIVNNAAARIIRESGIEVVQNKCIKIEHSRLFIEA